jgi:glycerol kinase
MTAIATTAKKAKGKPASVPTVAWSLDGRTEYAIDGGVFTLEDIAWRVVDVLAAM